MPIRRRRFNNTNALLNHCVSEVAREAALEVESAADRNTPVDTGLARASWDIEVGHVIRSVPIPPRDRFQKIAQSIVHRARKQASRAALQSYRRTHGDIVVINRLPYIRRLENGHSQQKPNGFIQQSIAEGLSRIR